MDRTGALQRVRPEVAQILLWLSVLGSYGVVGAGPGASLAAESGRTRWLDATIIGGTEDLVLWAPDGGVVKMDSTDVPGATMYRADGHMPGVEATVVSIEGPQDGRYRITGTAPDSTSLSLEVMSGLVAGRCDAVIGVKVRAGQRFQWTFEYEAVGTDSCRVAIVDW